MVNRILIITDDPPHADALADAFCMAKGGPFHVERVRQLSAAYSRLADGDIDAILADLSLPDSQGIDTFDKLFAIVPHTPIVTFCEPGDERIAIQAVQRGAQGCLPKGYFGRTFVTRSINSIIQRKNVEETLFIEKSRAEITLNSISDAVITTDIQGSVDYLNLAAEKLTGWSKGDALGRPIGEVVQLINGTTRKADRHPVELALEKNEPMGLSAGTILIRRDGSEAVIEDSVSPIHDSVGQICGAVMVFHDISASKAMTEKMSHLAQHDFLTDLPNRLLLNDRISQAIELAARRGTTIALLFLDLDNFKAINDSFGHDIGDQLLRSVARRLISCVRSSDTVSRLGGDEFVVLVLGDDKIDNSSTIAEKILKKLAEQHLISNYKLHVTPSIGISTYPIDGRDPETLIKKADMAMYQAKAKGRNKYQFFSSTMNNSTAGQSNIEAYIPHGPKRLDAK